MALLVVPAFLMCSSWVIYAQQASTCLITGTVKDTRGTPLAFANVYVEGRLEGAMTDEEGRFSFRTRAGETLTLICSYIGYQTFQKKITPKPGERVQVDIVLREMEVKGEPVTITASAFTSADREGVTLTSLDVVTTPGAAADVFWAIKTYPGLQQVEEGAGLFVRGGDVSETLTILDGAVVTHPYRYESPTGGFFGTFSPFLLKGTFFSSGGFSARYGNALSAVLAMESQDLPARRRISLGLGLAAESIWIDLPLVGDKLGLSFSGNRSNTRMMFQLNKAKREFSQYPMAYDANLNLMYRYSPDGYLKLFLFREVDRVGVEVVDPVYEAHYHGTSRNSLYNFKFSKLLSGKWLLQGNVALNEFERDLRLSAMQLDIQDRLHQFRLSGEGSLGSGVTLRVGAVQFWNRARFTGRVPKEELDLNPEAATERVDTDYRSHRAVGFLELESHAPFGLVVIPGIRGEWESISGDMTMDPRLSLSWLVGTYSRITAAWGVYHQYPRPEYYDPYIGNPQLSAMRSVHSILGYVYQKEGQIFRIEAYRKDYRGLLLEDPQRNYVNEGYGYAKGIDVFVKRSLGRLSGWVSYSYLKARRKWMDYPRMVSPYFDITHNFTAVLKLSVLRGFEVGLSYRYATGKPYTPAPGQYNVARVPDYQKLDLSLSCLYSFFEGNLTVFYLAVSNLLNRVNIFDYRYSSDYSGREPVKSSFGRSVYFGVSFAM